MTALAELEQKIQAAEAIERLETALLCHPQVDCPLVHHFAPNCYVRQVIMPAGTFVVGHEHKTKHFNIVLTGRARVLIDGKVTEMIAPAIFTSEAGVRKALYILEEMKWATVHVTPTTDLAELEDELIVKSQSFVTHHEKAQLMKESLCLG